ncbi:MAG: FAD:protein FMN transferase [Spirochaetaceae bacterium]|nr:FAD:protein FMN transferase [Spirochaetaceae bacterium]
MNKHVFLSAIILTAFLFISCGEKKAITSLNAMDTFMTIQVYGKKSDMALEKTKKLIYQIERNISTTNEASDVYRLNHGEKISVSSDTLTLTKYSLDFAKQTDGVFNPALYPITSAWGFTTGAYKVPSKNQIDKLLPLTDYSKIQIDGSSINLEPGMALDFGAIGKGYTGDEAIKLLQDNGIHSALLDLGGNIQALGKKPDGTEWTIGIKSPWTGKAAAVIKIADQAVITSGGYERFFTADDGHNYIHIFDGKTGMPVDNGIAGVTIITESGLYADALSTTMFVMGLEDAAAYWKNHSDYEMIIFTENQDLYYTEGLEGKLKLLADFASVNIIHK